VSPETATIEQRERTAIIVAEEDVALFIEAQDERSVIDAQAPAFAIVDEERVSTIEQPSEIALLFGPEQGPPGTAGEAPLLVKVAGETLSGHRAVFVDTDGKFYYADKDDEAARVVAGITTGAVVVGGIATARFAGVLVEPSWAWTPALPIFLSTNGMLTQSAPSTGYVVEIGRALTATSILVEFGTPVLRS